MHSEIVSKNGHNYIYVNDKCINPMSYMTYNPNADNYNDFADIGIELFSLGIYMGNYGINGISGLKPFRNGFYKSEDAYDFSDIQNDLNMITCKNQNVYIIPRVYLDCPKWWAKKYPGELSRDFRNDTVRQSFASEKWRHDALNALFALIDFIDKSKWKDNIIGYQVAAGSTEEWIYHRRFINQFTDYSGCSRNKYLQWLKQRYGDIGTLNKAWKQSYSSFELIEFPQPLERKFNRNGVLRDTNYEQHIIDFYQYHNHLVADTILYFCKEVKEYTHYSKIMGAFYGYVCDIVDDDYGHHALQEVLNSEYIDFLASPNSYFEERSEKNDWPFMSAVDSAALHHKIWFIESDTRTCLTQPLKEALPNVAPDNDKYSFKGVWKGPESLELSISLMKRGFGKILTSQLTTWWFDMWGGWYKQPDMMQFLKQSKQLMDTHIHSNSASVAEIALIVDEISYSYFGLNNNVLHDLVYDQRKQFGFCGAPYHIYLLDDIADDNFDWQKYKMFVFVNCVKIKDSTADAINKKLKNNHNTLLWIYLEDMFDKNNQFKQQNVTDFSIQYNKDDDPIRGNYSGSMFPENAVSCPRFDIEELNHANILGYDEKHEPVIILKTYPLYNSVYCIVPNVPANLITDLAVLSGVHVYSYTGDIIYADSDYITIYSVNDKEKRIYLPCTSEIYDAFTIEKVSDSCEYFDFKMGQYETRIFKIVKRI